MSGAAPDLVEAILGWRSWLVVSHHGEQRLRSVVRGDLWEPRQAFVAECPDARGSAAIPPHDAPIAQCTCGVHATRTRSEAMAHLAPPSRRTGFAAIGKVAMWGAVVEGELGWRASRAYPEVVDLVTWRTDADVTADLAWVRRSLQRDYGVRVGVIACPAVRAGGGSVCR